MIIEESFIESLLYEEEGVSFDVKSSQYKFLKATDDEKSELLKDILSFCNAWRRTDAYIVVGVKEVKGGKNELCGVSHFIDDAQVQQFVNGKTQVPIDFSFVNCKHDGYDISIIHIPLQKRPVYLKNDYGRLKKNVVYVRRGSSTGEATPEEIIKMGQLVEECEKIVPDIVVLLSTSEYEKYDDIFVQSYDVLNSETIENYFANIVIKDEDIDLVVKHKKELDSIKDRHKDGRGFYPFKTSKLTDFKRKVDMCRELFSKNFTKFCQLNNLLFRSFELSETPVARIMKDQGAIPYYGKFRVSNTGKCPLEEMIIYIKSNEYVRFLSLKELLELSIDINSIPGFVATIINKARELERGCNIPIMTRYEQPHRYGYTSFLGSIPPLINHFGPTPDIVFKISSSDLVIEVNTRLMHNHKIDIECEGVYLCPMISEGNCANVEYEVHAANLPDPKKGFFVLRGKNFKVGR